MKPARYLAFAAPIFYALSASVAQADTGTWTATAGGNWTDTTKWSGATLADGADNTANFTSNITAASTVSLNAVDRSIGNLVFSDNGAAGSAWTISGNTLTLAVTSGTPTITTTTDATISSNLAGTAGFTKDGAGTLTINTASSNTITGTISVNTGKLSLVNTTAPAANTNKVATTSVVALGGGTFEYIGQDSGYNQIQDLAGLTINSGSSSVISTKTGGASSFLRFTNNMTRFVGGTVDFSSVGGGALNTISTTTNTNGIAGGFATLGGTTWAVYGLATNTAITGLASFATNLTASTVNVDLAVGNTNATTNAANSLRFNSLGAHTLTLAGATTLTSGGILVTSTVGNNASLITGGTSLAGASGKDLIVIQNNPANSLTIDSAIIDNTTTTGLTKSGAGTLVVSGTNNYGGITTINGGTLQFAKQVSLYNNTGASWTDTNLLVKPGTTAAFNVGGTGEFTSTDIDTLKALGTATGGFRNGSFLGLDTTNATGGNFTYASVIANTNGGANVIGFNKLGTGTLTLTGANTYTGGTTVTAGTLTFSGSGTPGATTGTLAVNGGILDLAGASQTAGAVSLGGGTIQNGTLTGTSYSSTGGTISAILAGTGGFTQISGTTTLSGSGTLGAATGALAVNGGVLDLGGTSQTLGAVSFGGGTVQNGTLTGTSYSSTGGTVSAALGGSGTFTNVSGTTTLSGTNTYAGATTVTAGTLVFAKEVSLYNNTTASWTATNLVVNSAGTAAFNVGGTGEFTSADIDLLKGLGTASGGFKGGSLIGLDTTNAGGTFTYASIIANTNAGANAIGLNKSGTGTLTLTGANTYTGGTVITAGTLEIGVGGNLGGGTYAGAITGAGSLIKSNAGTLTLTSTGTNYSGTTTVGNGTLNLQGTSGYVSATTVNTGTTLTVTNSADQGMNAAITLNNDATLTHSGTSATAGYWTDSQAVTVAAGAAVIFNEASVTHTSLTNKGSFLDGGLKGGGANTVVTINATNAGNSFVLRNTGTSNYSGKIIVNGIANGTSNLGSGLAVAGETTGLQNADLEVNGTLELGNLGLGWAGTATATAFTMGTLTGTGVVTNNNATLARTLTVGKTDLSGAYSGVVKNGTSVLAFTKLGSGTQTLSGPNTYTGVTTVTGGTLLVNNTTGSGTGTGAVTVATTATLGGTGTVSGDTTIAAGATVAPGASAGTLTLGSTATLAGTYQCQLDGAAGDRLTVTGALTITPGAAITISSLAAPTAPSYTILSYASLVGGSVLPTITPPSGYTVVSTATEVKLVSTASGYASWAATNAPTGTSADDYDGDGVSNGLEWVLGGLASTKDLAKLPAATVNGGNLVFTFVRNDAAWSSGDTTVKIEAGTTLASWPLVYNVGIDTASSSAGVTVTDNGTTDTITLTVPQAPDAAKFARLKVVITP